MSSYGTLVSLNPKMKDAELEGSIILGRRYVAAEKAGIDVKKISGKHCEIESGVGEGGEQVVVKDYSSNGTFLNEKKIGKGKMLSVSDGDIISLCTPFLEDEAEKTVAYRFKLRELTTAEEITDLTVEQSIKSLKIDAKSNMRSIYNTIRKSKDDWKENFVNVDGLGSLLDTLELRSLQQTKSAKDFEMENTIIRIVMELMNTEAGFQMAIKHPSVLSKLVLQFDSSNVMMKKKISKLMSGICIVNEDGHEAVIRAFENYRLRRRQKHRFECIIENVEDTEDVNFVLNFLTLVNAIVNAHHCSDINKRVALRADFLEKGFLNTIDRIRRQHIASLDTQLDIFLYEMDQDTKSLEFNKIDLTCMQGLFDGIKMVHDSNNHSHIISFLQYLLMATAKCKSEHDWLSFRRPVFRLLFGDSGNENLTLTVEELSKGLNIDQITSKPAPPPLPTGKESELLKAEVETLTKDLEELRSQAEKNSKAQEAEITKLKEEIENAKKGAISTEKKEPVLEHQSVDTTSKSSSETPTEQKEEAEDISTESPEPPPTPPEAPPAPPPAPGAPAPPGAGPPPPPAPGGKKALPDKKKRNPSKKMKQIYWKKIGAPEYAGSIWEGMKEEKIKLPEKELEAKFQAKIQVSQSPIQLKKQSSKANVKSEQEKQLEAVIKSSDRERFIGIFLARLKIPIPEISTAINTLDFPKLSKESISNMMKFLPTSEEEKVLNDIGDKNMKKYGKAENFLYELTKIENPESKMKCILFKYEFEGIISDIESHISNLKKASVEVLGSKDLKKLFEIILAFGNYMNGQTFQGGAHGFKLSVLPKLVAIKSLDGETTLLHFIASQVLSGHKNLISFGSYIESVEIASAVPQIPELRKDISQLEAQLSTVEREIEISKENSKSKRFASKLKNFHSVSSLKVKNLRAEFEVALEKYESLLKFVCEGKNASPESVFGVLNVFTKSFEKCLSDLEREKKTSKNPRKKGGAKAKKGYMDDAYKTLRSGAAFQRMKSKRQASILAELKGKK